MKSVVREIDAFYEATGPFAVPKDRAEYIYETAASIVSRHTGPIALKSIRGANIPLDDNPMEAHSVRLGHAPHSALLTKRNLTNRGIPITGNTQCDFVGTVVRESQMVMTVLEPIQDPVGRVALIGSIHEMGHSFGLQHCANTCIMVASWDLNHFEAVNNLLAASAPFCGDCVDELEVGGYQALAQRLSKQSTGQE